MDSIILLPSYSQCEISFILFGSYYRLLLIKFYISLCRITHIFRFITRFFVPFETIVNFAFLLITFSVYSKSLEMQLTFGNLLIISNNLPIDLFALLCKQLYHLKIMTVLFLSFPFPLSFSSLIVLAEPLIPWWTEVVRLWTRLSHFLFYSELF